MRICLISTSSIDDDPRARAQAAALSAAGHELCGVSYQGSELQWVRDAARPSFGDRLSRKSTADRAVDLLVESGADLYLPVQEAAQNIALRAAEGERATVVGRPGWAQDDRTLIWRAPREISLSRPSSDRQPSIHVPGWSQPQPAHATGTVVVAYRRSERNPGRYLEEGFRSLGLDVMRTQGIAWDQIPPDALGVFIVESKLPGLPVSGTNPGVPVVFWVHHGEHHLSANVRLQRRYGASAVALAHSWHLAHHFHGLVERLPFAVAPEIADRDFRPHGDRSHDVGFVGSPAVGDRYQERVELLEDLTTSLGEGAVALSTDMSPAEMMKLYRDSRIVPDDGHGRHFPITMRAFEATGAGATLLSRYSPGLGLILDPEEEFMPMDDQPADQIHRMLDQGTEEVGRAGHSRVWDSHTYVHRADTLLNIASRIRSEDVEPPDPPPIPTGHAGAVDRFPDAQRILDLGEATQEQLPDREVWRFEVAADRAEPRSFQVSVITSGNASERRRAVEAARMAVVTPRSLASEIGDLVEAAHGEPRVHEFGDSSVFVFGSSGYRVSPDPEQTPVP